MDNQQAFSPEASSETVARKPWKTPQVTTLPVEKTANNISTGNDGMGSTTNS